MASRTLLIDGDPIAFQTAARAEVKIDWGDGEKTREADLERAKTDAVAFINDLKEMLDADAVIVAVGDPSRRYFRHDIFPDYKLDRTHGEPPLLLRAMKDFLRDGGFESRSKPGLEADDVLGILATHPTLVPGERIVVSVDKDLRQIPGKHFNFTKPKEGVYEISEEEGDCFFFTQILTGDPTDGYKGCPRIGPVKAKKILDAAEGECLELIRQGDGFDRWLRRYWWEAVAATYAAKGLSVDYALTQARVARILRHTDWDFAAQRPILWKPANT